MILFFCFKWHNGDSVTNKVERTYLSALPSLSLLVIATVYTWYNLADGDIAVPSESITLASCLVCLHSVCLLCNKKNSQAYKRTPTLSCLSNHGSSKGGSSAVSTGFRRIRFSTFTGPSAFELNAFAACRSRERECAEKCEEVRTGENTRELLGGSMVCVGGLYYVNVYGNGRPQ